MCNTYALDTISTGMVISLSWNAMKWDIDQEDSDGKKPLRKRRAMRQLMKDRPQEGIGNLLAEGVMKASQQIGKGSEQYAIHVKARKFQCTNPG